MSSTSRELDQPTRGVRGRSTSGFTLVEVLVALVLLSVSVLGLMQLQWNSVRAGTSGSQATLVQVQALDMGERIWMDTRTPLGNVDAWREAHESSLPGWEGDVEADASDPLLFRIVIRWDESRGRQEHEHWVRIPGVAP